MNYGANIKRIRLSKGIMAKYMAQKLGISKGSYCDLEKGRKKLSADLIVKIAEILNVNTDDILCPHVSETLTKDTGTGG